MGKKNEREMAEEIRELYEIVKDQEAEIAALKKKVTNLKKRLSIAKKVKKDKERTVRTWKVKTSCRHCSRQTENHVAFIDEKIYLRRKLNSLLTLLRKMGYLVNIDPNKDTLDKYRVCKRFSMRRPKNPSEDIKNMKIPDGIDEELLKELFSSKEEDVSNGQEEE